jgi:hypothetical protein
VLATFDKLWLLSFFTIASSVQRAIAVKNVFQLGMNSFSRLAQYEVHTHTLVNTLCAEIEDELSVGGVFLRLYNSQPGWTLREPRQFMIACFEKFVSLCSDRSTAATDQIQQLALAITNVLRVNTTMVDSVAALGMGHLLLLNLAVDRARDVR